MKARLQTPRHKILELLKFNGTMTADELSEALKITAMGVRRHLTTLERDGLIHYKTLPKKLGRPSFLYSLTKHGDELFPRTYAQFAASLLETIRAIEGDAGLGRLFDKRTELLEREYHVRMTKKTLKERVAELTSIRTEEGYMANWEQLDRETFLLREHNCAICQIARRCSSVCAHELELFQRVLDDAEVAREKHIMKGDWACTYVIRRKRERA